VAVEDFVVAVVAVLERLIWAPVRSIDSAQVGVYGVCRDTLPFEPTRQRRKRRDERA
jgi:hypothetical protein